MRKKITKELEHIEKEQHQILSELERIEKEEKHIEYFISWRWIHSIQFTRAFVGSVLGIVLSSFLFGLDVVNSISFGSALLMFALSVVSATYVAYKTEKGIVAYQKKLSWSHTIADVFLYVIVAVVVSYVLLFAFDALPSGVIDTIKILLVFSLPAIAGALTLTIL